MRKAAALVSLLIAAVLLIAVSVSFGVAVHTASKQMEPEYRKAEMDAALAGKEIVEPDSILDGPTELIMGLSGAAFLIAGLALWPRRSVT
jgi:hypothetical protein